MNKHISLIYQKENETQICGKPLSYRSFLFWGNSTDNWHIFNAKNLNSLAAGFVNV